MNKKEKERRDKKKQKLLQWVLSEWDCFSIEDALRKAETDKQLHYKLRELGVITKSKPKKE